MAARKAEEVQTQSYRTWVTTVRELDSAVKFLETELGFKGTGPLFVLRGHKSTNNRDDFRKGIQRVGFFLASLQGDTVRSDTEKFGRDGKGNSRSPKEARTPSQISSSEV